MRVALSMLTLVPGISGGSETYARALAGALARRGAVDVLALVPTLAPDAGAGLPTRVVDAYPASTSIPGRLLAMARAGVAPGAMREAFADADVVHYPLTVPVPRPRGRRRRIAITLHDLQHRDLPSLFPRGELLFRRLAYDRAAAGADAVIVPSAFVRDRAVALLGLPPERLHVVPLGVDLERFTPGEGERRPFLLYPARPWPHKDHEGLLAAFRLLRARQPELELVLTGAGTERFAGIDGVRALGTVGLDRLVELYRTACCCVVPSRYEGFGLPPLEAMACGTPVAAARSGSLPEVCGDAAVLFDPGDAQAMAAGVDEAIGRATELTVRGLAHAARFTWDATAEAHERLYRSLA